MNDFGHPYWYGYILVIRAAIVHLIKNSHRQSFAGWTHSLLHSIVSLKPHPWSPFPILLLAFNDSIILSISDIFSFISRFVILNYVCAHGSSFISKCSCSPFSYQGGRRGDRNDIFTQSSPTKTQRRLKQTCTVQFRMEEQSGPNLLSRRGFCF